MERILNDEEKLKKAEEIYNRRKNINVTVPSSSVNRSEPKRDLKQIKKMLFQIGICTCIYISFYFVQYSNYYFSGEIIKKVEEVLAYDINFNQKFLEFNEFFKNNKFFGEVFTFWNKDKDKEENNYETFENEVIQNESIGNLVENNISDNHEDTSRFKNMIKESENSIIEPENDNIEISKLIEDTELLGIGGGENINTSSDDEQMEKDAQTIKNNYQITLPLRGTVTSRYGEREIEPKFHTGIDVARDMGSEIISATNGSVILVEEQKLYGKVLKIQNKDLVTLYAHCDEILVNVGDKITMMQKIAKVGSTGNSTGPHLHFEIIYCGRYVNPELVMQFKE